MVSKTVTLSAKEKDARQLALITEKLSKLESRIFIEQDNKKVNAKSIMGLLSVDLRPNSVICVKADGIDEDVALEKTLLLIDKE